MSTLLIDATSLSVNPKGVGKYAYEVIARLDRLLPLSWSIFIIVFREEIPEWNYSRRLKKIEIDYQSSLKLGLHTVPALIKNNRADLLLRLCDNVGGKYSIPTITVCHDINELIAKAQGGGSRLCRRVIDGVKDFFRIRALRASTLVICNSEFTRQQCALIYGIKKEKTAVGYCGVADNFYGVQKDEAVRRTKSTFGCEHYILCFATGDPRENYTIIPDIIAATKRIGLHIPYVIAGIRQGHPYARELESALLDHMLVEGEDYFFVPFLGNSHCQQLSDLYAAADYYLELSLHEGFGMQLAEAMACGTQCLAPDHSGLTEVGGPFVLHIDPLDVNGIADTIVSGYRKQLHVLDHSEQIKYTHRFSWDESASLIAKSFVELG